LDGLVAGGVILDVEVVFRQTRFRPYYDPVIEYSKMLTELVADDQRNRLIAADIADEVLNNKRPGVCLVLSDRKQHCLTLQALLRHKYHLNAEVLTGDLSMEQRNKIIEKVNHSRLQAIIATGQLIGEGIDCAVLSTLFLATPIRFSGRLLQYLGRILRPNRGIERAKVYDYIDELVGPLKAAARAREKVYRLGR
jgi:superfamily II DNA or RNA helicase